ncbi:MAG TPA: response regulator, partial [Candidatus Obscuribacterales bacterium]
MFAKLTPRTLLHLTQKLPLQAVLVLSFGLQIAAAVGLTTALSWRNGQKAVDDLATQLSARATARIHEHLNQYLAQPNLLQRSSRSTLFYGDIPLADAAAIARQFWHQIRASDGITSIYLGYPDGRFIGIQERASGQAVLWEVTPATMPNRLTHRLNEAGERREVIGSQVYDPRSRPWYQAVMQNRRTSWSPIYEFASNDYSVLGITLATPIQGDRGQLRGVLALDLTLEQISRYLRTLNISPNGEAFIIERSGNIVATSAMEPPFSTLANGTKTRLSATASSDPLIRETAQYLSQRFGSFDQIQMAEQLTFERDQESQLVQIMPFRDGRGLDWLVVTVIPESDFKGQIAENTRNTLLLCLLSLIVASIIAGITARWVAQPIRRLSSTAQKLAVGNWDHTLPEGRFRELTELSTTFESMAQQLKQSFAQLEDHNQELQRLDRLKDEFLANTSHELRTPLNGIIGLAESLIDGVSGPLTRQTKGNLAMIVASGRRLSALVDDILDFSQLKHNRVEISLRAVGVREAAEVVLTLSRPLAGQKQVQLINAVSPKLPLVLADENRLQQILHNLVGNAVKFTEYGMVGVSAQIIQTANLCSPLGRSPTPSSCPPLYVSNAAPEAGSPVTLAEPLTTDEVAVPQHYLAITVSDTGIGIPEDKLSRIFEPFEQGDGSTARLYGGMGIGLAVTKKLVELQGGTIQVWSAVGVGSQFTFTLPIAAPVGSMLGSEHPPLPTLPPSTPLDFRWPVRATLPSLMAHDSDSHDGEPRDRSAPPLTAYAIADPVLDQREYCVLVVDDEPINRQVIMNHLAVKNYRVVQAASGAEALALLADGLQPDVVLLDVMMPRMTGFEVCRKLRESYPAHSLPIVMLTAKNQVGDLVEGLSSGANDYLTKPVSKSELLARLKTHLYLAKINQAYSRFVPREFLQFLQKESIVEVELGDQVQQHMSVLFADIRDFTTLSEQMNPEQNFKFINAFLSRMEPAIAENQGF